MLSFAKTSRTLVRSSPVLHRRASSAPGAALRSSRVVGPAPCACGGGCPRCRADPGAQTKLTISEPGDQFEQEADRIANEVMRAPESVVSADARVPAAFLRPAVSRAGAGALAPAEPDTAPLIVREVLRSPGQPLEAGVRAFMEPRFGHDFSQVRIHADTRAAESARAVNARAYTLGQDVVFGAGQYAPGTATGQRLLAHELTHVMQQGSGAHSMLQRLEGPCKDISTPHRRLVRGSVEPAVREAQRKLNLFDAQETAAGRPGLTDAPLVPDCIFGQKTFNAVFSFQEHVFPGQPEHHVGQIGDRTWAELDKISGTPTAPTTTIPTARPANIPSLFLIPAPVLSSLDITNVRQPTATAPSVTTPGGQFLPRLDSDWDFAAHINVVPQHVGRLFFLQYITTLVRKQCCCDKVADGGQTPQCQNCRGVDHGSVGNLPAIDNQDPYNHNPGPRSSGVLTLGGGASKAVLMEDFDIPSDDGPICDFLSFPVVTIFAKDEFRLTVWWEPGGAGLAEQIGERDWGWEAHGRYTRLPSGSWISGILTSPASSVKVSPLQTPGKPLAPKTTIKNADVFNGSKSVRPFP